MSKSLLSFLFTLSFAYPNNAAARMGTISGRVTDGNGKPLVFASVLLQNAGDSALVKTELTDKRGEYKITPVADGNYTLKITLLGYEVYTSPKLTVANNNVDMPVTALQQQDQELKEVSVTVQKPFIEVHADKLVVNVE